jgi:hypothetical protein
LNHEFAVLTVIDVHLKSPNHFCPSDRKREGNLLCFIFIYIYLLNPFIYQVILLLTLLFCLAAGLDGVSGCVEDGY